MQAMIVLYRRYKLVAAVPPIEIDDAYIGGERTGERSGRGRRGHTPFIIAVETSKDGRPLYARLQVLRDAFCLYRRQTRRAAENGNVIVTQCNTTSGERSFLVAEGLDLR